MKYRIENGKVTISVEEFNRINDLLESSTEYVDKMKRIEKKLKDNTVATEIEARIEHSSLHGYHATDYKYMAIKESYTDLNGILKKAVNVEFNRMAQKIKEINQDVGNRFDLEQKIKFLENMSMMDFIRLKIKLR